MISKTSKTEIEKTKIVHQKLPKMNDQRRMANIQTEFSLILMFSSLFHAFVL